MQRPGFIHVQFSRKKKKEVKKKPCAPKKEIQTNKTTNIQIHFWPCEKMLTGGGKKKHVKTMQDLQKRKKCTAILFFACFFSCTRDLLICRLLLLLLLLLLHFFR